MGFSTLALLITAFLFFLFCPDIRPRLIHPHPALLNIAVDPLLYNTKCLPGAIMKIHRMTGIRHDMGCKVARIREEITIGIKDIPRPIVS